MPHVPGIDADLSMPLKRTLQRLFAESRDMSCLQVYKWFYKMFTRRKNSESKNPRHTQSDEQVLEPTLGPDTTLPTTLPTPEFHPLVYFFNGSGSDEPSQLCQELVRLKFAKIFVEIIHRYFN